MGKFFIPKISGFLVLFLGLIYIFKVDVLATNYYVATTGSDSNPGTQTQPWQHVQKAVDSVNPGDIIYLRSGTYNESVKITKAGTTGTPITLTNYPSETATIDGGSSRALYPFGSTSKYWIIIGLRFLSTNTFTIQFDSWGCNGTCGGNDDWTFKNNYISGAVQIYGADNLFDGNEIDGSTNNGNSGNGIQAQYDVSHNNTFRNNYIHNFSSRGIWTMHRTHDDVIENNTITDITSSTSGQCIDADGFGTVEWKQTIRGNKLTRCGLVGIQLENVFSSVVENNIINNPGTLGIAIINYGPTIPSPGTNKCQADPTNTYGDTNGDNNCEGTLTNDIVRQNLIYNTAIESGFVSYHAGGIKLLGNTIVGNSSSKWGIRLDNSLYCPQIEMQSNIIMGHSQSEILMSDYASITVDNNNLFYNTNPNITYQKSDGKTYWQLQNLPQYQSATGKGQNSIFADPQFVNPTANDFHLKSTSFAINHGVDIGLTSDLDGTVRPQGGGYDIGAYEYALFLSPTPSLSATPTASSVFSSCTSNAKYNVGNYLVLNNQWNVRVIPTGTPYSQCVTVNNNQSPVEASWNWSWPYVSGGVKAYPEVIYGMVPYNASWGSTVSGLPVLLSNMGSYAVSFDTNVQTDSTAKYNTAFDIWTTNNNPPTAAGRTNEIMIMSDYQNPWFDNPNPNLGTVTIDGQDYRVNKIPPGSWTLFNFVKINKTPTGTINVDHFLKWLITNNQISPLDYLTDIEFGNEIQNGSGTTTIRSFSVSESQSPIPTATVSPTPITKPGDANGDGKVDGRDFSIWLSHYGQNITGIANGDFDNNGKVDGRDYSIWLNNYTL